MQKTLKGLKETMKAKVRDSSDAGTARQRQALPKQQTLLSFSQKSAEQDKVVIYVDTREHSSQVAKMLSDIDGEVKVDVKVKQLEVGDYVLSDQIVVERKTIEDFLQSIIDGRLFAQLVSMSSNYDRPLIILEGNYDEIFSLRNIHRNAIMGALSSIATTYGIPIIYTSDAHETMEYLFVIAKREQLGKDTDIKLRIGRKGLTLPEQQQFIVESLPLIGPVMAKKLLEHFGSVENLFSANVKELQEIENMGPKKAEQIRKVLGAKYLSP
jgi:Fanconi anemia group M protein